MNKISLFTVYIGILMTTFGIIYSVPSDYYEVAFIVSIIILPIIAVLFSKFVSGKEKSPNTFLYGLFLFPLLSAVMNGFLIYDIRWAVVQKYGNAEYSYTIGLPFGIAALLFILYLLFKGLNIPKIIEALVSFFITMMFIYVLVYFMIMLTIGYV